MQNFNKPVDISQAEKDAITAEAIANYDAEIEALDEWNDNPNNAILVSNIHRYPEYGTEVKKQKLIITISYSFQTRTLLMDDPHYIQGMCPHCKCETRLYVPHEWWMPVQCSS